MISTKLTWLQGEHWARVEGKSVALNGDEHPQIVQHHRGEMSAIWYKKGRMVGGIYEPACILMMVPTHAVDGGYRKYVTSTIIEGGTELTRILKGLVDAATV